MVSVARTSSGNSPTTGALMAPRDFVGAMLPLSPCPAFKTPGLDLEAMRRRIDRTVTERHSAARRSRQFGNCRNHRALDLGDANGMANTRCAAR